MGGVIPRLIVQPVSLSSGKAVCAESVTFGATIRHSPELPHTAAVAPARDLVLKRIMCDSLSLRVERSQRDGLEG